MDYYAPVKLPFPGPGLEVAWPFHISSADKFCLEVEVPIRISSDMPVVIHEKPSVNCDLLLELKRPNGNTIRQSIKLLRYAAPNYWGHMESYLSQSIALPESGDYTFHLRNLGDNQLFCPNGASITFTRFQHPTERFLQKGLTRVAGGLLLLLGSIAALTFEILEYVKLRSSRHVA